MPHLLLIGIRKESAGLLSGIELQFRYENEKRRLPEII